MFTGRRVVFRRISRFINFTKMENELTVMSNIKLLEEEKRLFDSLLAVVHENQLNLTLRVAGGWVRDKVPILLDRYWAWNRRTSTSR